MHTSVWGQPPSATVWGQPPSATVWGQPPSAVRASAARPCSELCSPGLHTLLDHLPRPPHVLPCGSQVANGEPQHITSAKLGVGDKKLPRGVHLLEDPAVIVVLFFE